MFGEKGFEDSGVGQFDASQGDTFQAEGAPGFFGQDEYERKASQILKALGLRAPQAVVPHTVENNPGYDEDGRLSEKIIGTEKIWGGNFLQVESVEVELPDGEQATRDIIRHPGAVGIIAIDDDNRILLERQYRCALERLTLEIPAGKLDVGETAEECARRELEEETGYTAGKMAYLIPIASAAGYSDEIIHLFMATDLKPGLAHPDSEEFVATFWMDIEELIDMVLDGKIEDSKTIIAALTCDAIAHRI